MPYAAKNQISQAPIEGGIEITEEQYMAGLQALLSGMSISIVNGFEILPPETETPPDPPDPEDPEPPVLPTTVLEARRYILGFPALSLSDEQVNQLFTLALSTE